ncbi:S-adenosyl-L-methionine dependent methyltransferase, similar to cyclopropane-fatty-acyl-phospholipid synthase [Alloactinosynnema sp. L-07]|uniref:SAM-dependent methyltransferase n=1 Tax=Alloactinosynnema sp. L-07 TaxID=1653480 RepID=UPI00065EF272|nr:cyclopropane-fatty-acyl-phospholipid synthase family protein [Alloactinosynnema sp. L-07]CRK56398.1 S-adenosyl-L-methionine dependent methyltransferase, similar to cyclopropane-fatty-acyl-phospholipid synthase [Alloactinosynnema sp. L-07]
MTDTSLRTDGAWGGLFTPPHSPARARIARALFANAVRGLPIRVVFPGGHRIGAGGPRSPVMRVHRPSAFFHRLGVDAKVGFGESYMAGDWTSTHLVELLTEFAARLSTLIPPRLQALRRWVDRRHPADEQNTVDGARANIHRHYDLSNDLFATFLDQSMTYSSAWFETGSGDLHKGQIRKIDGVLDYADVRPDSHVLEIGTGWGALAIRAAERGARVTSLTISAEQKALAERRVAEAGLTDRVQVLMRDYREAHGTYDAVVSVEMIEAVGERYWPTYFATVDRLLKPGGRFGLQAITMPHDRMLASRDSYTWIHKYIFPGGLLPSPESMEQTLARHTGMRVHAFRDFGLDYAETLRQWRVRFLDRWHEVADLGFDETFRRMWEFYLAYSEAGFRSGYLNVRQLSIGG